MNVKNKGCIDFRFIIILMIVIVVGVMIYSAIRDFKKPSITLIYPNAGEELEVGSTYQIKWKAKNMPSGSKIFIMIRKAAPYLGEGQEFDPLLFVNLENDGAENWTVSDMFKDGDYILEINAEQPDSIFVLTDESDTSFKIHNPNTSLANPASQNCINKGGTLKIERRGDDGEYGICFFEDNKQCEEWALFNGSCPEGGLKVIGYATPAAVYCVITGGTYAITSNSNTENEQGTCKTKNNTECDVWDYYNGKCN